MDLVYIKQIVVQIHYCIENQNIFIIFSQLLQFKVNLATINPPVDIKLNLPPSFLLT